jgi:hypothetical protein
VFFVGQMSLFTVYNVFGTFVPKNKHSLNAVILTFPPNLPLAKGGFVSQAKRVPNEMPLFAVCNIYAIGY